MFAPRAPPLGLPSLPVRYQYTSFGRFGFGVTRAAGKPPKADLPDNLCFMMVNLDPIQDIAVRFKYHLDEKGVIIQDQFDDNFRTADMVNEDFGWAARMYGDMFGQAM